ncbi:MULTISPECIES: hypothetical protein [unclassified Myroides]|uniref:hypothetical protein n=1 Tax=unclassified Myroides TaxID=2642485 RepID=UPI0031015A5C
MNKQLLQKLYSQYLNYYFYSSYQEDEVQARKASTEIIFNLLFIALSVTTLIILIYILKTIGINHNTKNVIGKITLLTLTYTAYVIAKKKYFSRLNNFFSSVEVTQKPTNNYIIYYSIIGIFAYFGIITSLIIVYNKIF